AEGVLADLVLGASVVYVGRTAEAVALLSRALQQQERLDVLRRLPLQRSWAGMGYGLRGEIGHGKTAMVRMLAYAREEHTDGLLPRWLERVGTRHRELGDWIASRAALVESIQRARVLGQRVVACQALAQLSGLDGARGDEALARAEIEEAGGEA